MIRGAVLVTRTTAEIPGTFEPGYTVAPLVHNDEGTRLMRTSIRDLTRQRSNANCWTMGECSVVVAQEPAGANGERLWHLSISCTDRHPSWDEIKTARYRLLPRDKCFGMLLPPPQHYVNIEAQDHVFHLWEITDPREPWTSL